MSSLPGRRTVARSAAPERAAARRMAALHEDRLEPAATEESEDWVVSYMDMVTLLMIVFLTLVGMMWFDKKTRPTVVSVLQIETGQMPRRDFPDPVPSLVSHATAAPVVPVPGGVPAATIPPERILPANVTITPQTRALVDRWVNALRQNNLEDQVKLQVQEHRVTMAIRDRLLFPSGQIEIQPGGDLVVRRIATMLGSLPGLITVEGHTDDVPIHSDRFPSNWELSAGRAASVVRALAESGIPVQRLRAVGYADSRPVARGSDDDSRARNRRVEIVVEDWK